MRRKVGQREVLEVHEDNEGHLNLAPCQCRRVRRMMGEGAGDLDEDYCLFMGRIADLFTHNGRGRPVSVDEAKALIKKTDDIGCVHQITTLHTGETFAICNCQVESCLAPGVTQYFNTPNFTKSNYVAEIDPEKCVACGRCTDHCANNAITMGQKLCAKEPIVHKFHELPDDQEWGPDKWNPNHRSNREYISPEGTAPCKVACALRTSPFRATRWPPRAVTSRRWSSSRRRTRCPPSAAPSATASARKPAPAATSIPPSPSTRSRSSSLLRSSTAPSASCRAVPMTTATSASPSSAPACGSELCLLPWATYNYSVTVFDKNEQPGGMLRYGIPNFRLEKSVPDAEIDVLKELGAIFKCGVEVGKDVTPSAARAGL